MENWSVSFRIPEGSDFETRYQEVLSGQNLSQHALSDAEFGKDAIWSRIVADEPSKPYAVYIIGARAENGSFQLTLGIDTNP